MIWLRCSYAFTIFVQVSLLPTLGSEKDWIGQIVVCDDLSIFFLIEEHFG